MLNKCEIDVELEFEFELVYKNNLNCNGDLICDLEDPIKHLFS